MDRLDKFNFQGENLPVNFRETEVIANGVECDTYDFTGDREKDLGIIRIQGEQTPKQKVVKGDKTIETFMSGAGRLKVKRGNGWVELYEFGGKSHATKSVEVSIGDEMQWQAGVGSHLEASEVCLPPYEDGRFVNL